jgi:nucleotide-binding universal stress UspA family protein
MAETTENRQLDPGKPIDVRNIALALDCSTLNRVALETAVNLAAATGAKLRAVFIEDECLYSLAAMPFAREISFSGKRTRSFSSEQISLEIKKSADAARTAVAAAAGRARVKWAFDTTRGQLDDALARVGDTAEILALGSSRSRIGRVHSIASLRASMHHGSGVLVAPITAEFPGGPVVAVISPGAEVGVVVKTAERISSQSDRSHRFLIVSGNAAERAALHQGLLEAQASTAEVSFCDVNELPQVTRAVRLHGPGLVIADIDYAHLDDASSTERVSEAFGAPLILVQV